MTTDTAARNADTWPHDTDETKPARQHYATAIITELYDITGVFIAF